jgi:hypothetical protein
MEDDKIAILALLEFLIVFLSVMLMVKIFGLEDFLIIVFTIILVKLFFTKL